MKKLVTLGELLLRFTPPGHLKLIQTETFEAIFGGAEANVAVSARNYGIDAYYVTKLPAHDIGTAAVNSLRKWGIGTDYIARGGERIGTYFFERGAGMRPAQIVYDRRHSSMAEAAPTDFDWDRIFEDKDWFHWSGITPALSPTAREICLAAVKAAKEHGLRVSVDLNYRGRMWTREEAGEAMKELCKYSDVCITSDDDAEIFGLYPDDAPIPEGKPDLWNFQSVAQRLKDTFGFDEVAVMRRRTLTAGKGLWDAMLLDSDGFHWGKVMNIEIVDTIGCGDAFCGGFIAAELLGYDAQKRLDFASAAGCLKHTVEGDFNMVSIDDVHALMNSNGSAEVKR